MTEVMLSIQPKWCELIANGKKTVEIRKTRPKLDVPFKCYIYCTKASKRAQSITGCMILNDDELFKHPTTGIKYGCSIELMGCDEDYSRDNFLNGKVIGHFICDEVMEIDFDESNTEYDISDDDFPLTKLTQEQLIEYGKKKDLYAWRISDLKIYEEPKEISDFVVQDKQAAKDCTFRQRVGVNPEFVNGANLLGSYICTLRDYEPDWCSQCRIKPLTRAPQGWCYVEGVKND